MTKFGTRPLDRATAINVAIRDIGRLINFSDRGVALIGFTQRELKRRDVVSLVAEQEIQDVCTAGQPFWFQARIWFEIGDPIGTAEWREISGRYMEAWEARHGAPGNVNEEALPQPRALGKRRAS
jgi:hypothetical protein